MYSLDVVDTERVPEIVWSLAVRPTPATLAILLECPVKLSVEVDAELAHVVMVGAEVDPASFSFADWPPPVSAVNMVPVHLWAVTYPTDFLVTV